MKVSRCTECGMPWPVEAVEICDVVDPNDKRPADPNIIKHALICPKCLKDQDDISKSLEVESILDKIKAKNEKN